MGDVKAFSFVRTKSLRRNHFQQQLKAHASSDTLSGAGSQQIMRVMFVWYLLHPEYYVTVARYEDQTCMGANKSRVL